MKHPKLAPLLLFLPTMVALGAVVGAIIATRAAPPPRTLPCQPTDGRHAVFLAGTLDAGEGYRETFGPGWQLDLMPLPAPSGATHSGATYTAGAGLGWQIRVLEHDPPRFEPHPTLQPVDAAVRDLAALTPPLRGPNPRFIEARHFLNTAGDGPNQGEVNAPQRLRPVIFSPGVGRQWPAGENLSPGDLDRIGAFGRAGIRLTEITLSDLPPAPGTTAGLGELDPAYDENVDWLSADSSGITLGKEGASSVLDSWDGTAWISTWLGD